MFLRILGPVNGRPHHRCCPSGPFLVRARVIAAFPAAAAQPPSDARRDAFSTKSIFGDGRMSSIEFTRRLSHALLWGSVLAALLFAVTG